MERLDGDLLRVIEHPKDDNNAGSRRTIYLDGADKH